MQERRPSCKESVKQRRALLSIGEMRRYVLVVQHFFVCESDFTADQVKLDPTMEVSAI